jgi:molybdopterin synthase catalytic subunit
VTLASGSGPGPARVESEGSGAHFRFELVERPLVLEEVTEEFSASSDGAVVAFVGVVRGETAGRRVLRLEYEAYEPMVRDEMARLLVETRERYPVRAARVVHRVGAVPVGEPSVVIAVAAAHRGAAFDACRHLIERLKADAPIWKREHFDDGAVWVTPRP